MYTSFKVQIIKKETLRKAGKNMYYHPVFARYLSAKILVLIDRTVITYVLVQKWNVKPTFCIFSYEMHDLFGRKHSIQMF